MINKGLNLAFPVTDFSVVDGNITYTPQEQPKRCGWLCRLTRGVIIGISTALGGAVGGAVGSALASQISFREEITYDGLPLTDQNYLQNWAETRFIPFYEKLLVEANNIYGRITIEEQISRINAVEAILSLALENITASINGSRLSTAGKEEAISYTKDNFYIIRNVYAETIQQLQQVETATRNVYVNDYDFSPLFVGLYPITSTSSTFFQLKDIVDPNGDSLPIDNQNTNINEESKKLNWILFGAGAFFSYKAIKMLLKK